MDKTIRLLCDAHELKHIESIGKDLMPVADALQPLYHLLESASVEWHQSIPPMKHTSTIERGPHYASITASIRTWIAKQTSSKCITTEFVLKQSGRSIHVHIHPFRSTHDPTEVVRLIWIWLQTLDSVLAHSLRTASCSRELHIHLFLTPFLKQWPKALPRTESKTKSGADHPSDEKPKADKPMAHVEPNTESIEEIHVNSGFAFPCSKETSVRDVRSVDVLPQERFPQGRSSIVQGWDQRSPTGVQRRETESASGGLNHIYVYREEEWFKVLIHETIHAFGVDFSAMSTKNIAIDKAIRALDTAFPGVVAVHNADKNRICLFEAYTECWAEWIAILFRVHEYRVHEYGGNNKNSMWKSDFVRHLELERRWSMLQASRMNAWFASNPSRMYHNRTPVFAYYVLKSVLMRHSVAFMAWCNKQHGTNIVFDIDRVESFGKFLRDHAHAVDASSMQLASSMNIQSIAGSSLRMSLWGD